jgi:hypothetical protein
MYCMGYGQWLKGNQPSFQVNISALCLVSDDDTPYSTIYHQSIPSLRQYSKMSIKGVKDEMNTSTSFSKNAGYKIWRDIL